MAENTETITLSVLGERVQNVAKLLEELRQEIRAMRNTDCPACRNAVAALEVRMKDLEDARDNLWKAIGKLEARIWWLVGLPMAGLVVLGLAHLAGK